MCDLGQNNATLLSNPLKVPSFKFSEIAQLDLTEMSSEASLLEKLTSRKFGAKSSKDEAPPTATREKPPAETRKETRKGGNKTEQTRKDVKSDTEIAKDAKEQAHDEKDGDRKKASDAEHEDKAASKQEDQEDVTLDNHTLNVIEKRFKKGQSDNTDLLLGSVWSPHLLDVTPADLTVMENAPVKIETKKPRVFASEDVSFNCFPFSLEVNYGENKRLSFMGLVNMSHRSTAKLVCGDTIGDSDRVPLTSKQAITYGVHMLEKGKVSPRVLLGVSLKIHLKHLEIRKGKPSDKCVFCTIEVRSGMSYNEIGEIIEDLAIVLTSKYKCSAVESLYHIASLLEIYPLWLLAAASLDGEDSPVLENINKILDVDNCDGIQSLFDETPFPEWLSKLKKGKVPELVVGTRFRRKVEKSRQETEKEEKEADEPEQPKPHPTSPELSRKAVVPKEERPKHLNPKPIKTAGIGAIKKGERSILLESDSEEENTKMGVGDLLGSDDEEGEGESAEEEGKVFKEALRKQIAERNKGKGGGTKLEKIVESSKKSSSIPKKSLINPAKAIKEPEETQVTKLAPTNSIVESKETGRPIDLSKVTPSTLMPYTKKLDLESETAKVSLMKEIAKPMKLDFNEVLSVARGISEMSILDTRAIVNQMQSSLSKTANTIKEHSENVMRKADGMRRMSEQIEQLNKTVIKVASSVEALTLGGSPEREERMDSSDRVRQMTSLLSSVMKKRKVARFTASELNENVSTFLEDGGTKDAAKRFIKKMKVDKE